MADDTNPLAQDPLPFEAIVRAINAKCPGLQCPACRNESFRVEGGPLKVMYIPTGDSTFSAAAGNASERSDWAFVYLVCTNCGHVLMFEWNQMIRNAAEAERAPNT